MAEEKEVVETEEVKEEPSLEEQISKLQEELADATNKYYKASGRPEEICHSFCR